MAVEASGILGKSSSAACAAGPLMRAVLGLSRRARAQSRCDGARARDQNQLVAQSSDWQQSPHNKPKHESCNTCESRRDSPTWSTISRVTTATPAVDSQRRGLLTVMNPARAIFRPSPVIKRQSSTHDLSSANRRSIDRNSFCLRPNMADIDDIFHEFAAAFAGAFTDAKPICFPEQLRREAWICRLLA